MVALILDKVSGGKTWLQVRWPGMSIAAVVAVAALFLAEHYGAPVMLFALLLGMALNFLSEDGRCKPGIEWVSRQVLRWGVALLGLKISLSQVVALGWLPVGVVVLAVAATIGFGMVMARVLGFQPFFGFLSGGAVGICGASAAMAISAAFPHHPRKDQATLFVVVGVSALSTLAMVFYPMAARWWGLDVQAAGFFLGGTIHDVAQVVGAGYSMGTETGDVATLVKLMRVAMLVPVIAVAALLVRRLPQQGAQAAVVGATARPPLLPGFAVAFLALVLIQGVVTLPAVMVQGGNTLSRGFLVAAMAAIGMKTRLQDVVAVGWKPVLLMVLETVFLAALVLGMLWAMTMWN